MSKHTQGEWRIQKDCVVFDEDGQCAQVCGHNKEANARLISAAPELLAALEQIENIQNMGQLAYLWDFTIEPLIAKAKGE